MIADSSERQPARPPIDLRGVRGGHDPRDSRHLILAADKDFEESAVLAEIVPAEQIGHPREGRIELRVNGQTRQSSDLSLLIHRVPEVIAHLSTFYHLQAGDLIYTGTPEGVGAVRPGDEIAGSIEGIGTIALTIGEPL